MSKNPELDALKSREQDAFQRKQAAFGHYTEMRDLCSAAHDAMQTAWEERCSTREEMNREFDELQKSRAEHQEVWSEYEQVRDENNSTIAQLRAEADSEHQQMIDCFNTASDRYENGDRSEAPYWSQQGHDHKDRRDELNEEVSRLCQEIRDAKQSAQWRAPQVDSSAYHRAKDAFERAKSNHESAQAEFKRLKSDRDRAKADFDAIQNEYLRIKDELQRMRENEKGITFYDRNARPGHPVMGINGGVNIRGDSYNPKKHPEVIGHSTQYYSDGVRVSRDTRDGIHEENIHWTDSRLPNGHRNQHKKPSD